MSSNFFVKCLEWSPRLPERDHFECPDFLQQGRQCSFRLAKEWTQGTYSVYALEIKLYVNVRNGNSKWEPCNVNVLAGFKKEQKLSLGEKTCKVSEDGLTEIWRIQWDHPSPKLPPDFDKDNCLKFIFRFERVLLGTRKQTEDKCFQTGAYLNTYVPMETLVEDMSKLLDSDVDHDAEIKCGEHSIKVHKIILSTRSEVFRAMLQSNMLEGRTGIVEIQDIDASYIQNFVRYLYTGAMPELTFEMAKGLYEAGDKYAVRSLMLRCSEYLQDIVSPENALECLALADAHSDDKLIASTVTFCIEQEMYLDKVWPPFCETYPKAAVRLYRVLHINDIKKKDA